MTVIHQHEITSGLPPRGPCLPKDGGCGDPMKGKWDGEKWLCAKCRGEVVSEAPAPFHKSGCGIYSGSQCTQVGCGKFDIPETAEVTGAPVLGSITFVERESEAMPTELIEGETVAVPVPETLESMLERTAETRPFICPHCNEHLSVSVWVSK